MLMLNINECQVILSSVKIYCARDLFDFSIGYLTITIQIHDTVELNHIVIHTLVVPLHLSHLVEYCGDFGIRADVERHVLK